MRSWTTSGLPVARCKVTKKSSGMHDSGRALGQRDTSSLFLSFAHHPSPSSTNPAMPLQGFARTCVPRRREIAAYTTARNLAGSRRSYSLEAPPSCDSNPARPASTSLGDSPNFRRARTAAARLGIRRMNRQSSIFLNSCGVSIIWSRCPRVTEGCLLAGLNERPPLGFPCGLLLRCMIAILTKNRSFGIARAS